MRLLWVIGIDEYDTSFCGAKLSNRFLCVIFALLQLSVVIASFLQHVYSFIEYRHVFNCHSNIPANATWDQRFLAYDIIIFDFGLMHRILGTTECVANYLDGGYMRSAWCVEQASALMLLIVILLCIPRPVWLLWPALLMQSSYVLGMAILTMATAPKLLAIVNIANLI
uniref:7TM_GPCR_Srx domain-containing protein n=1 Tax=Panagrellus redivivus TaxID=6233 RepID=A0A7E4US06_PANRE